MQFVTIQELRLRNGLSQLQTHTVLCGTVTSHLKVGWGFQICKACWCRKDSFNVYMYHFETKICSLLIINIRRVEHVGTLAFLALFALIDLWQFLTSTLGYTYSTSMPIPFILPNSALPLTCTIDRELYKLAIRSKRIMEASPRGPKAVSRVRESSFSWSTLWSLLVRVFRYLHWISLELADILAREGAS